MEYDNTNRGRIFRKEDKKSERHPDMDGHLNVEGVEYYVNGWTKTAKNGKKFLSLSIKPKDDVAAHALKEAKQVIEEDFEDDIPF
jgi:uncharacterized protein (DUF736 family)